MDRDDLVSGIALFALIGVLAGCATALIITDHGDWAFSPGLLIAYLLFG